MIEFQGTENRVQINVKNEKIIVIIALFVKNKVKFHLKDSEIVKILLKYVQVKEDAYVHLTFIKVIT
jgi:hypothetical protein